MRSSERNHAGGNNGGQVSIELLEPAYLLPNSICLTNSACLRDYPTKQRTPLLAMGAFFGGGKERHSCLLAAESAYRELRMRSEGRKPLPSGYFCKESAAGLRSRKEYQPFGSGAHGCELAGSGSAQ